MTNTQKVHDGGDPLEAELQALRPVELPPQLVARIGRELTAQELTAHSPTRRLRTVWLAAAAAVAACLVAAAVVWRATAPAPVGHSPIVSTTPVVAPQAGSDEELPALATYHRALSGPPAALDELLDRHAARSLSGGPRVTASSELGILR